MRPPTKLASPIAFLLLRTYCMAVHRLRRSHRRPLTFTEDECFPDDTKFYRAAAESMQANDGGVLGLLSPSDHQLPSRNARHNNLNVTGDSRCDNSIRFNRVLPDTPPNEKAICSFKHVINYNPKRIPRTIVEAKCTCSRPRNSAWPEQFANIHCEQLKYKMRVLMFDEGCEVFHEELLDVTLACIPVADNQDQGLVAPTVINARQASRVT